MNPPPSIEAAARARIARCRGQIERAVEHARAGVPLAAERDPARLRRRLRAKTNLTSEATEALAEGIEALAGEPAARPERRRRRAVSPSGGAERIYGTIDFVGIAFLEAGLTAGRAVGRVAFRDGRPQGSGFLVSDRLFLTNNHVIASRAEASRFVLEFDYELDGGGVPREPTRYGFAPDVLFLTSGRDDLDFTLVAVGSRESGRRELGELGHCLLSDARDKHALGEWANIVQHPDGRYKEVVLRENRLVARLDTVLHYVADTEPGSSGSPVFNNEWEVIALHHWGGPWRQSRDDRGRLLPTEVNEGIRISAIVHELKAQAGGLRPAERGLLEAALASERARPRRDERPREHAAAVVERLPMNGDGSVTWRVPIEISVRMPGVGNVHAPGLTPNGGTAAAAAGLASDPLAPERAVHIDRNYDNRPGYRPAFLGSTHRIERPRLSAAHEARAARNRQAEAGDDPFELKYQHFSVVLDKKRRLARYTACNVDGRSSRDIDRKTGAVSLRRPSDGEGAEASEQWFGDDRVDPEAQTSQQLYESQEVPGFPNKRTKAFQDRMFQRGHLVRRTDPAWGSDDRALRADADTFHFANCTPQVGFFNTGSAPASTPDSGGGRLWRAVEDYVLDNAVNEQKRVSVFTGPVLDDQNDPKWRQEVVPGFRVPLRFWKVVVWVDSGRLRSLAMLADQEPVIKVMPEAIARGEAFADISKVEDFVVTVTEVERLTGLTFDDAVRAADINGGESRRAARAGRRPNGRARRPITSFEEIGLLPQPGPTARRPFPVS